MDCERCIATPPSRSRLSSTLDRVCIQRQKTPLSVLSDGNDDTDAGHKFYRTPNDIILCDGRKGGLVEKYFIAGLYDYDMNNPAAGFSRLSIQSSRDGTRSVPPYSGEDGNIPNPAMSTKSTVYSARRNARLQSTRKNKKPWTKPPKQGQSCPEIRDKLVRETPDLDEGSSGTDYPSLTFRQCFGTNLNSRADRTPPPAPRGSVAAIFG